MQHIGVSPTQSWVASSTQAAAESERDRNSQKKVYHATRNRASYTAGRRTGRWRATRAREVVPGSFLRCEGPTPVLVVVTV